MAVEAVLREPLSRPYSLLSGINTGIFHPHESKAISRAFL
jgi:hypothetical protein